MAVGQIIGRVSVKVIPDTKDFRDETQRKLNSEEKRLVVNPKVTITDTEMRKAALTAVRNLNRVLDNAAYKVRFHATFSPNSLRKAVVVAQKRMDQIAKMQKIKFDVDVAATLIEARVDQTKLKEATKVLKDWRDNISPLRVAVVPFITPGATTLIDKRLDALTRPRAVPVVPLMGDGALSNVGNFAGAISGFRLLQGSMQKVRSELLNLDKAVPKIAALTTGILGLAAAGLSGASNIFSLSASIAQMAPAALVLPGIFAGLAIGMGATAAVLKDFNKVLPEVGDKFSALQDSMSIEFWNRAAEPIRNMVNTLFPMLEGGLTRTAGALGTFFTALSNAFSGKFDGKVLGGMFNRLNESIAIFAGYADSVVRIIRILGGAGSRELPILAEWFGQITERFANFLKAAESDGRLSGWIETGITRLQEFGNVIGSLVGILSGIATAAQAAGGSTLGTLAAGLERISDVVNTPAFQGQLTNTLKAAHDAMAAIGNTAGPAVERFFSTFATTLQTVLPIVGTTIGTLVGSIANMLANPAVQTGFTNLVKGISGGVMALAPAFDVLAPKLGAIMSLVGTMATVFGGVFATAIQALAPGFTKVVEAIGPLIETAGPILQSIIEQLGPVFETVSENVVKVAEAAKPLIEKFGEFANTVLPVLVPILQFVADLLGNAFVAAIDGVMTVLDGLMQMFEGFGTIVDGFKQLFSGDIFGGLKTIFSGLGDVIMGALRVIAGAIWTWLNVSVIGFFRGGLVKLITIFKTPLGSISTLFKNFFNAIKTGATNFTSGLKNIISGMWGVIKGVFQAAWAVIKGIVLAGWNVIRGNFTGAKAALEGIIKGLSSALGNIFVGMIELLSGAAGLIWSGVQTAFKAGIKLVKAIVKGIPTFITGVFAGAGTLLKDIGGKIIDGLKAGIESGVQKVKDLLNSITDKIPDWKGPEKKDKKLLTPAGQKIMEGLLEGIASRVDDLEASLGAITDLLPKHFLELSKKMEQQIKMAFKHKGKKAALELAKEFKAELAKALSKKQSVLVNGENLKLSMAGLDAQYATVTEELEKQQGILEQMKEAAESYRQGIVDAIKATGDITSIGRREDEDGNEFVNFDNIMADLTKARDTAAALGNKVTDLIAAGLNTEQIQQIVGAAPDVGLATAEAILAAGPEGITALNAMQADLSHHAGIVAAAAAANAHADGIAVQQGLVTGLTEDQGNIEEAIELLAKKIAKAFRKAMKIKSPSRVMAALARNIPLGVAKGITDNSRPIQQAVASLANGLGNVTLADSGRTVMDSLLTGMESRYSKIGTSLSAFGSELGLDTPAMSGVRVSGSVSSSLGDTATPGGTKVLNYYAAEGTSLDSQEDLFAAAGRARFVF